MMCVFSKNKSLVFGGFQFHCPITSPTKKGIDIFQEEATWSPRCHQIDAYHQRQRSNYLHPPVCSWHLTELLVSACCCCCCCCCCCSSCPSIWFKHIFMCWWYCAIYMWIKKIHNSFCLFVCLFVCLFMFQFLSVLVCSRLVALVPRKSVWSRRISHCTACGSLSMLFLAVQTNSFFRSLSICRWGQKHQGIRNSRACVHMLWLLLNHLWRRKIFN